MTGDLQAGFGSLTADDVATLDRAAVASGVTVQQLMEIAGWQVARCAWLLLGEQPAAVLVVAGRGNNGGDALVAARHLHTWGCDVCVYRMDAAEPGHLDTETSVALVLDGILGTGLRSAPRDSQASAIRAINAMDARVLAIDVPSGMDATTGEPYDPCVRATATCTLAGVKAGLWHAAAHAHAGRIWAADIGMPRAAWDACALQQPHALRGGALLEVPIFAAR